MRSSIYVSDEQIQVIGYTGSYVNQFVSYPLPEGTVRNGIISDSAVLAECLDQLRRDNPELFRSGVTLIMDGDSVLSSRITAPKLSNKQYRQLVRDEFADITDNADDLVCGYRKLGSAEKAILACAISKVQIENYVSAFDEAVIKLEAIHAGADVILNCAKSVPELRRSTVVINVVNGPLMLSMVFENGENIFMSRSRIYEDENTRVFQSILESLGDLIEYARTPGFAEITGSYYLGVNQEDMEMLVTLNPYSGVQIDVLEVYDDKSVIPPDAFFAGLNMFFGNNAINFIAAYKELNKSDTAKTFGKFWIPIIAAYMILLIAPTFYLWLELDRVEAGTDEIIAYIESPAIIQKQKELNDINAETVFYNDLVRQIDEKTKWEGSMPKVTGRMMDLIVFLHGVDVAITYFDFNESTGIVRISASCADAGVTADFVDAIENSGIALSVDYQGYGSGEDNSYIFTADITLDITHEIPRDDMEQDPEQDFDEYSEDYYEQYSEQYEVQDPEQDMEGA